MRKRRENLRMSWNYRVMRTGEELAIHEVFYNEDGSVQGWTSTPVCPRAESFDVLRSELERYSLALTLPVLENDT